MMQKNEYSDLQKITQMVHQRLFDANFHATTTPWKRNFIVQITTNTTPLGPEVSQHCKKIRNRQRKNNRPLQSLHASGHSSFQ